MRFSRTNIIRVKYSFDVGNLLDGKLNFNDHFTMALIKNRSVLGYIKWLAIEFSDPYITK